MNSCTWCEHGGRTIKPATHVVLFACVHEHFVARAICARCAKRATGYAVRLTPFTCQPCRAEHPDQDDYERRGAAAVVALVCTRQQWLTLLDRGAVRFTRDALVETATL